MEPLQDHNHESDQETSREMMLKLFPDGVIPRLKFKEAVGLCFDRYATFKGRSRRSEFWWFYLAYLLAVLVPCLPVFVLSTLEEHAIINTDTGYWVIPALLAAVLALAGMIALIVFLVPAFAVQTRRLHDIGRSGWWVVWSTVASCILEVLPFFIFGTQALHIGSLEQYSLAFKVSLFAGVSLLTASVIENLLWLTILVFSMFDSLKDSNKYGRSPKYLRRIE